jgi:GAF domain-containing protein
MRAPLPPDERERLKTLRSYQVLDSPPEMRYEDLTLLAARLCRTPIAAISLVDEDRQWFKSIIGLETRQTSRDVAFCAHAILQPGATMVVEDATRDERFVDNGLVAGSPGIRFYAGTPLTVSNGQAIGTLCVIDTVPRTLTELERQALEVLGRQVVAHLELRRNVATLERTARRLARREVELRRAQRQQRQLKDQFISHVSHELRPPLTSIQHFVQVLLDGIGGPLTDDQREYLGIVHRNCEQLGKMIDGFLEL